MIPKDISLAPTFTPIPNPILDEMHTLSDATLRVALAVWRYEGNWLKEESGIPPTLAHLCQVTGLPVEEVRAQVKHLRSIDWIPKYVRVYVLDGIAAGVKSPVSRELRAKVFARDNYECLQCGATEDLTVDHIKPQCLGGEATEGNLRVLCRSCNSRKGAKYDTVTVEEEISIE